MKIKIKTHNLIVSDSMDHNRLWIKRKEKNIEGNYWYRVEDDKPANWALDKEIGKRFKIVKLENRL